MARVRFIQAVAGPDFSYSPGEVVDLPGEQAEAWADGVRAVMVRSERVETPEARVAAEETTATSAPAATAEKRPPARRAAKPAGGTSKA